MKNNTWLYRKIMYLSIPVALENLVYSLINFIDIFMVGKENPALGLGASAISALGVSNQIFFLFTGSLYGILSGSNILAAQYFGSKDYKSLRKIMAITLIVGLMFSLPFIVLGIIMPEKIIGFYTQDVTVIKLAKTYFRLIIYTFPLHAIGFSIAMMFRATNMPKYSLYASITGLVINISLNLILIPNFGVLGAATATLISRIITVIYVIIIILYKKIPIIPYKNEIKEISFNFISKLVSISSLTFVHEVFWSLAFSIKVMLYGKLGTIAFSSVQIATNISGLIFTLFIGISSGTAVIIGNEIGKNNKDKAYKYSKECLKLFSILSVLIFISINVFAPIFLRFMKVNSELYTTTLSVIRSESFVNLFKGYSVIFLIGILRAGGDIFYPLIIELGFMWIIGIPITYFALLYKLPIAIVYLLSWLDDLFKLYPCVKRYLSKKWITNLTKEVKQ
ncbi:MATE family efflux transporter [Caviibacter abscessus]|uniref:MATE family efflux transporter n=1 Tax=Caviibacter abscessus TaxID=1766719 RepID=UPI000832B66F|nr:MATE family efflux transporter [Caviibacter abscessus]